MIEWNSSGKGDQRLEDKNIDAEMIEQFVEKITKKGYDWFRFKGYFAEDDLAKRLQEYFKEVASGAQTGPAFPFSISTVTMATSPDMPRHLVRFHVSTDEKLGLAVKSMTIEREVCYEGGTEVSKTFPVRSMNDIPAKRSVNKMLEQSIRKRNKGKRI